MKKILFLVLLVSALSGCTQTEVRRTAAGYSSLQAFLPQWEEAQSRFINGDSTLWKENASQRDDATVLGAFGGYEKGWNEVGPRYDWASSQFKESGAKIKVEYLNTGVSGELAFTVAIERQEQVRLGDQEKPAPRALRVTQIFRKEGGAWKLLHRHADPLIEKKAPWDSYDISALLVIVFSLCPAASAAWHLSLFWSVANLNRRGDLFLVRLGFYVCRSRDTSAD